MTKSKKNTAVVPADVQTVKAGLSDSIEKFVKDLAPAATMAVHDAVKFIHDKQVALIENALAIGDRLNKLRTEIGSEAFGKFMSNVLPQMGIGRSLGYLWTKQSVTFKQLVPNANVRNSLYALTSGRGIISTIAPQKGKTLDTSALVKDASTAGFTPSFAKAIKEVGDIPKDASPEVAETYARRVIELARKNRKAPQDKASAMRAATIRLTKALKAYHNRFGSKAALDLVGAFDKWLTSQAEVDDVKDEKAA